MHLHLGGKTEELFFLSLEALTPECNWRKHHKFEQTLFYFCYVFFKQQKVSTEWPLLAMWYENNN